MAISSLCRSLSESCLHLASFLTEPVCIAHRTLREVQHTKEIYPEKEGLSLVLQRAYLGGQCAMATLASPIALVGMVIRAVGIFLQVDPFLHRREEAFFKPLADKKTWRLLSWNVPGLNDGHPYTNAGVAPFSHRVDAVGEKIIKQNADVVCLYEMMDLRLSRALYRRLKKAGYRDFYFNIGPSAAVSSGLFVASKFTIENPEFTPFKASSGRTWFANKGVFGFSLACPDQKKSFARVFATHPQHSEESSYPTLKEKQVRAHQMQTILDKMISCQKNYTKILTGDLNLNETEFQASSWKKFFTQGSYPNQPTWDGDEWSATLVGDRVSSPERLDYTLVLQDSSHLSLFKPHPIKTTLLETGFDPKRFKREVLSDHKGMLCEVRI